MISTGAGIYSNVQKSYSIFQVHLTAIYEIKDPSVSQTTTKNIVISANFLVWKFYGKAQFPHSFGRIARTDISSERIGIFKSNFAALMQV